VTVSKPEANAPSQLARFTEAARAIGVDEDEATFKAKLAVIARQKPKGPETKTPPPKETA